jgi:hypothetical protein
LLRGLIGRGLDPPLVGGTVSGGVGSLRNWTDSKIRVQAFYCLLGFSLHYVLRQVQTFWPPLTLEKLQEELEQIQQFVLFNPALGGGPHPAATVVSTQSLIQKGLVDGFFRQPVRFRLCAGNSART